MTTTLLDKKIPHVDILGVNVSAINLDMAEGIVDDFVTHRKQGYVCVCPVSTIMECVKFKAYREVVNGADVVTPDGMPTVWIGRARGFKDMDRVYGPDLMQRICQTSQSKGYKHYFYGASSEALKALTQRLNRDYPHLQVCGQYSPPFRALSADEKNEIIDEIKRAEPDILWVGLGSPKQDFWMREHRSLLDVPLMIGVGAAFDFLSGNKPQAPKWVQRSGLEWLFRLCCEPRRLWRRYLLGNTVFVYLLIKEYIQNHFSSK